MEPIVIQAFEPRHLRQIGAWFNAGAADTLLKVPQLSAFDFSNLGNKLHAWVALQGEEVVGVATLAIDEQHNGHLNFATKPSEQRQGIGSSLLEYVMNDPNTQRVSRLFAVAEAGNVAAQKILEKNNLMRVGYSPEGYLQFERR